MDSELSNRFRVAHSSKRIPPILSFQSQKHSQSLPQNSFVGPRPSLTTDMKKNLKKRVEEIYPLTPLQQGLIFHSLFARGSGFYVVQFRLVLQELNKQAFQRAWQQVIDRHEILRTAFVSEGVKDPVQVVLSKVPLTWHEEDWRGFSPAEVEQKLQEYMEWDRTADYNFGQAPVMRVALMQTA